MYLVFLGCLAVMVVEAGLLTLQQATTLVEWGSPPGLPAGSGITLNGASCITSDYFGRFDQLSCGIMNSLTMEGYSAANSDILAEDTDMLGGAPVTAVFTIQASAGHYLKDITFDGTFHSRTGGTIYELTPLEDYVEFQLMDNLGTATNRWKGNAGCAGNCNLHEHVEGVASGKQGVPAGIAITQMTRPGSTGTTSAILAIEVMMYAGSEEIAFSAGVLKACECPDAKAIISCSC